MSSTIHTCSNLSDLEASRSDSSCACAVSVALDVRTNEKNKRQSDERYGRTLRTRSFMNGLLIVRERQSHSRESNCKAGTFGLFTAFVKHALRLPGRLYRVHVELKPPTATVRWCATSTLEETLRKALGTR